MSEEHSGILVGKQGDITFVRIDGKGTHLNSHLLKQYLLQCLDEKLHRFCIELSQCTYMDSTFLGTLAGIGIKAKQRGLPSIQLLNPTERAQNMLEGLGIDHLFEVVAQKAIMESLTPLDGTDLNRQQKAQEMLDAHAKLVEISPTNEAKFRDVIAILREKVEKPDTE